MRSDHELPALVKRMAALTTVNGIKPYGGEVAQRLLTNSKMGNVWSVLRSKKATPTAAALSRWQHIDNVWEISGAGDSAQDKACGVFFASALGAFGMPLGVITRSERKQGSKPWRDAAALCRHCIQHESRSAKDPQFANALALAGEYFEQQWRKYDLADDPRVVDNRRKKKIRAVIGSFKTDNGDVVSFKYDMNDVRGAVRVLAAEADALFGKYLFTTIATVATAALQTKVSGHAVRKLCDGLPTPLREPA